MVRRCIFLSPPAQAPIEYSAHFFLLYSNVWNECMFVITKLNGKMTTDARIRQASSQQDEKKKHRQMLNEYDDNDGV